jgi:hypothetical protein
MPEEINYENEMMLDKLQREDGEVGRQGQAGPLLTVLFLYRSM